MGNLSPQPGIRTHRVVPKYCIWQIHGPGVGLCHNVTKHYYNIDNTIAQLRGNCKLYASSCVLQRSDLGPYRSCNSTSTWRPSFLWTLDHGRIEASVMALVVPPSVWMETIRGFVIVRLNILGTEHFNYSNVKFPSYFDMDHFICEQLTLEPCGFR